MRKIDRWQLNITGTDVFPHIRFRPIGDGKHANVLTRQVLAVVEIPQFRALAAGIPATERIAHGEDTLLRAGAFLVAAGTAQNCPITNLVDGVYQRDCLQWVTCSIRALHYITAINPVLHCSHPQAGTRLFH